MTAWYIIPLAFIWSFYGTYCYSQYNHNIKNSPWYFAIALGYGLINNLIWVLVSKKLNQNDTLKIAMIWDSGVHLLTFLVPLIVFGENIKIHTLVGMGFIFTGVSIIMFFEQIKSLFN